MSTKQPTRPFAANKRQIMIAGYLVLCLAALAVFFARSGALPKAPALGRADPANTAQVSVGQAIYASRCAACHGASQQGAAAPELGATSQSWQLGDEWLFKVIGEGGLAVAPTGAASGMPAFGGQLSDDQIWAVIAFIKSERASEARAGQPNAP
jgi:mono/diheme cytochrome c family protein